MRLEPATREELSRQLAAASSSGGRIESVDLSRLNRLVEYAPEDMVVTVEGGMTLKELQTLLAPKKQWLPMDPPGAGGLTLARLISWNLSGPRRYGYGTVRDHLIGIKAALADGQIIKAGGKVVKNVAGYDLCKLFVGSHDSLAVIVEATFKVLPIPEAERFVCQRFDSMDGIQAVFMAILKSAIRPVVLDLHNLDQKLALILGIAGTKEDVAAQINVARQMGFVEETTLTFEETFAAEQGRHKLSCLPSETLEQLQRIKPEAFVARLGNGLIYYRGGTVSPPEALPETLMARVRNAYDPHHIFPDFAR